MTHQERLYGICSHRFEAARQVPQLGPGNPSSRLHGHSFLARTCVEMSGAESDSDYALSELARALAAAIEPLNYRYLNEMVLVPTDENLARHIRAQLNQHAVHAVGVRSTANQGVDVDHLEQGHVWKRFRFEAAHRLPNVAEGHPCGRMHGHGFEIVLHTCQAMHGKDLGVEFERLEEVWRPLGAELDHHCLNEVAGLENPTSEMIASWIWRRLKPELGSLSLVTVYETTTAGCHFDGQNYRIWKEQRFESALKRSQAKGPDQRLHGHSYLVRFHLSSPLDEVMGWTVDYGDVKRAFEPLYRQLDHHEIHEISSLRDPQIGSILGWTKFHLSNLLPQLDRIDLFDTPSRGASLAWGPSQPALLV